TDRPARKPAVIGIRISPGSCARCDDPPREATLRRSRPNLGAAVNRCDVPERDVVRSSPPPSPPRASGDAGPLEAAAGWPQPAPGGALGGSAERNLGGPRLNQFGPARD